MNSVWTERLNTKHSFPKIEVYEILKNGVLSSYQARPIEGYVMYDTSATDVEEDMPVTYYYKMVGLPKDYIFDNFNWVAVPRNIVDENYIF